MNPHHNSLVSCIMPTRNRRRFVSQAIYYFLRQTYSNKELIIVDDGEDSIADLMPKDRRIRYLRLEQKLSLAAKRNLACQEARGRLIAQWDDDDWMAPNRLSIQIEELLKADADLCGARELLHYQLESGQAWLYRYPTSSKLRLASCTLLYRRKAWETNKFAESDSSDAIQFIQKFDKASLLTISNPSFYIAVLHKGNTRIRNLNDSNWQRQPIQEVTQRFGQDREFYVKLRNNNPSRVVDLRNTYSVTCIMPTYNRRAFVPQAMQYFLQQDYPRRELIVVDDGTEPVGDLIPKDDRINYIKLPKRVSIGEKRNIACQAAGGDIIILWDDDDWYASNRISYQVKPLLNGTFDVTGLDSSLVFDLPSGRFWHWESKLQNNIFPKGIIPGSLAFWKSLWGTNSRFPNVSIAEDVYFLMALKRRSLRVGKLPNTAFFIYVRHNQNTWKFSSEKFREDTSWKEVPTPNWFPLQDRQFYNQHGREIIREKSVQFRADKKKAPKVMSNSVITVMPENGLVSACLLSYKRPSNLQPIVDSLHSYDFIDEILVWNNNPDIRLKLRGSKVRVIDSKENLLCFGRFQCSQQAKNSVIYVQDDDVIVQNVLDLYRSFKSDSSRITHTLAPYHYERRERYLYSGAHHALLGWGAFFRKEWLEVFQNYRGLSDDLVFRRGADKIFTMLLQRRHNTLRAQIQTLPYSTSPGIALYREPDHRLMEALASRKALASIRESKSMRFPVTWNVVIVSHNYGKYLKEAVNSVLANDADYVITIVDDASSDETPKICAELKNKYKWISSVRHEKNVEVSRARNSGIAAVDSVFVVLLDADDRIGSDYLFEAEKLLTSGYDVANPDAILFGNESGRWNVPDELTLPMLLERNQVHCCAAFRRSYWAQIQGLDETMPNWQDYDFWIRLAAAGARIGKLGGNHYFYRKHGNSKSSVSEQKQKLLKAKIRQKHEDLYRALHP
jgi:glycosyltransferase involved in cell wall biosynthesis